MVSIKILSALRDNYVYHLTDTASHQTAVIDPGEAPPVIAAVENGKLDFVWNTHHHWDHVGGNGTLQEKFSSQIYCSQYDKSRIPGAGRGLNDGESFTLGGTTVSVIAIPGHTLGHIAFHIPEQKVLFTGDTLFSAGCGRLFEGTADDLFASLQKLVALPDDTQVYCGHEYTLSNLRFSLSVEPNNQTARKHVDSVVLAREAGVPSVPSSLAQEKAINAFLRTESPEIRTTLKMESATPAAVFAELRRRKDNFL